MKRILACLATLTLAATIASSAQGQSAIQLPAQTPIPTPSPVPAPILAPVQMADQAAAPAPDKAPQKAPNLIQRVFDPLGDALAAAEQSIVENAAAWSLRATLYHGGSGMSGRDSLGCRVSPMRTVAVDPAIVSRRSIIFIKETVGLPLAGGGVHDGYWYASDTGGAIKGSRIDLFTGPGAGSMRALQGLNLRTLTVSKVGDFSGCPPLDGGLGEKVADAH
jgi:3D (Asp-Asp-Asp) domain-containing protein